jgi:bifunctional non-homologous end joining protein LigD
MNTIEKPPQIETVTLYFREGSSDKVYQCSIEPRSDLFVVTFAYGRRGSTLNTGTKTPSPVSFESARTILLKLVSEKMAKGYTRGEAGTPYRHSENESLVTGILPQLLNPIEETEAKRLLLIPGWCLQEKMDGRRLLIRKSGIVTGINRKGLAVGVPESILEAVRGIVPDFVMDGEGIGDRFFAFDLLEFGGRNLRGLPYELRLEELTVILCIVASDTLQVVPTATTAADRRTLFERLQREKKEGVVFKRLDAPYSPGRPNSGGSQLKHKFVATLSAVVSKVNPQRSVEIRLLGAEGWQRAGNVSIPANHPVPQVGTIVEVRYLYAMPESGALFQPVYLGKRKDVAVHECVVSQLKFKSSEEA